MVESIDVQRAQRNRLLLHELVRHTEQHRVPPAPAHAAQLPRHRPHRQPARRGRGAAPHAQRRQPAAAPARGAARLRAVRPPRPPHRAQRGRRGAAAGGRARAGPDRRRRARRDRSRLGRRERASARDRCCRRSRSAGCCRAWATGASKHPDIALELDASQQVVDLQREGFHAALAPGRRAVARAACRAADRLAQVPVGSPAAAQRLLGRDVAALAHEPLLGNADLWEQWFALSGAEACASIRWRCSTTPA